MLIWRLVDWQALFMVFPTDRAMQLNEALFTQNRKCGFVPKPKFFGKENFNPFIKPHMENVDTLVINLQVRDQTKNLLIPTQPLWLFQFGSMSFADYRCSPFTKIRQRISLPVCRNRNSRMRLWLFESQNTEKRFDHIRYPIFFQHMSSCCSCNFFF